MPVGMPSPSRWPQFCHGDSGRMVEQQVAQWVCQTLAKETFGAVGNVRIEFETDVPIAEESSLLLTFCVLRTSAARQAQGSSKSCGELSGSGEMRNSRQSASNYAI